MDRLDRLIRKARPPVDPWQRLEMNNPYMEKNSMQLLDMLCPETPGGYQAPEMRTLEWAKFMHALIHSVNAGGLTE